jgi:hypothetical protein
MGRECGMWGGTTYVVLVAKPEAKRLFERVDWRTVFKLSSKK